MHVHDAVPGANPRRTASAPSRGSGWPAASPWLCRYQSMCSDPVHASARADSERGYTARGISYIHRATVCQVNSAVDVTRSSGRGRLPLALGLVLALLVAVGCSDGGSQASPDDETTTTAATTTTQPVASDEASHEIVQEMVYEATSLADELFQDPALADDPDSTAMDRLREIYTDDSPTPAGLETQLEELVALGHHERPTANGMFREVSIYSFEPVDENTLQFETCSQIDTERVDSDGDVISTEAVVRFSRGEARRVDGVWRFYGLSNDDSRITEIEPGGSSHGFCARAADAASEGA